MDNLLVALILSIVEGITEYLPVSSSGHLILFGELLHFTGPRAATFEVVIQLGAIMAVVVLYWSRFKGFVKPQPYRRFAGVRGLLYLFLTSLPAALLGLILHPVIKTYLFRPSAIALALVAGAICMILVERYLGKPQCVNIDEMNARMALGIGFAQCLALWPGFSRSAATIMGGLLVGAKRTVAVEYSFIAAVPIMVAATGYDLIKNLRLFTSADLPFFTVGIIGAFISAMCGIKIFIALLGRISLVPFAIYRLILAPIIFFFAVME